MSLSMYQASVPVLLRQLKALDGLLGKGEAFAAERGTEPAALLDARLTPDMFPLVRQVQVASDTAKGAAARLAGLDVPGFPDDETSFADLHERIAKTIAFVESVPAAAIDGSEDREVILTAGGRSFPFTGRSYLLHFALPNFFFHVTAAYAILRQAGVPIGKMDYLGGF